MWTGLTGLRLLSDTRGIPTVVTQFDYICSWWRFYSRWQLQRAIAQRNYTVFIVVFYIMTAFVIGILGGCIYLYFLHKSRRKMKWQW